MSNSALAKKYIPSPEENHWGKRKEKVGKIIVHHAAGVISAENLAKHFADPNRKASATYCIGYDGAVVRCLDEGITPGTSGGYEFDRDAVTVEVSNSASGGQWPVSNAALSSLIKLCADIAKRNSLGTLTKGKNLCWHSMYQATACPGQYLLSKMEHIAAEANKLNAPKKEETLSCDTVVHTVVSGDTLSEIAGKYGTDYVTLAKANSIADPNVIVVGQKIKIPGKTPAYSNYTVRSGDSLWSIAARLLGNGARYTEIKDLNGLTSDMIRPAQVLKIPGK